jgi:hypothetical protein
MFWLACSDCSNLQYGDRICTNFFLEMTCRACAEVPLKLQGTLVDSGSQVAKLTVGLHAHLHMHSTVTIAEWLFATLQVYSQG